MAVNNSQAPQGDALQIDFDTYDAPLFVPPGKLDADQYMADDLDGVTESLFGSGNMSYAILQQDLHFV